MPARLACHGLWPACALLLGSLLWASPVHACKDVTLEIPAGAQRYSVEGARMLPYLVLWRAHRPAPLPSRPDRVRIMALDDRPLLLAYEHEGCVIGLLPIAGPRSGLPCAAWSASSPSPCRAETRHADDRCRSLQCGPAQAWG